MTGGASDPWDWVRRACQDARPARRLLADPPEGEVAAYHLQQAAEPEEAELRRRLGEVERFIEAVTRRVERASPAGGRRR